MKKRAFLLLILFMLTFNPVYAVDMDVKKNVDLLNKNTNELYEDVLITDNGATIFINDIIYLIDKTKHETAMLMEKLRNIDKYVYINYPIVSEIEHFGILSNYSKDYYSTRFFEEQLKDPDLNYNEKMIRENYVSDEDLTILLKGINIIDIDLRGLEIIFNPYNLYDSQSFGYFINYSKNHDVIRSRIYMNKTYDNIDYLSTFYHELGHFIYENFVLDNEDMLSSYYNLYKDEINSKYSVFGAETPWKDKLTENFAEDFKYYITNKVVEEDNDIKRYVEKYKDNFYIKWTSYPYSEYLDVFFSKLIDSMREKYTYYRPDIGIKLDDYKEEFKLLDLSYLDDHVNKIVTKSKNVEINLYNFDKSYLSPYEVSIYEIDNGKENKVYGEILKINTIIPIGTKDLIINLDFRNKDNIETVTYFIIKEDY